MSETPEDQSTPETPDAPSAATPSPAPAAPSPPAKTSGSVQVPVWLLAVLTVVVVGLAAFFIGRETAPESGDAGPQTLAEAVEQTASGEMEVGEFDVPALLQALGQNRDLDLGSLGELILGQVGRN